MMSARLLCIPITASLVSVADADTAWQRTFTGPADASYGLIRIGGNNILKCQGMGTGLSPFFEAYTPSGDRLWRVSMPGPGKELHAGPDGFTYICGGAGSQGAYVRCVRPEGTIRWTYFFNPDPVQPESFVSLRVEGDDMWVLGTQSAVINGRTRPVAVCVRLDLTSGNPVFVRTYPIWTDGSRDELGLKVINNAESVFLLVGGSDWHSLIRINPLNGSPVGRATFLGRAANDAVVDSVSNAYISSGTEGSIAKVNASGTGALPVSWSGVAGGQHLLLLKSYLWATQDSGPFASLRRVSAAGVSQVAFSSPRPQSKFVAMATEVKGRLFLTENWTGSMAFYWQNLMFDPDALTLKSVEPVASAETQMGGIGLAVSPDGTTYSSGKSLGPLLSCSFRTPAPVPDSLSCPRGVTTTFSAPGIMANDVDVDPSFCKTYLYTPPSHGTVLVNSNGSFRYMPAPGFTGVDSFTYRVRRGPLQSTAKVTLQVTP